MSLGNGLPNIRPAGNQDFFISFAVVKMLSVLHPYDFFLTLCVIGFRCSDIAPCFPPFSQRGTSFLMLMLHP